MRCKHCPSPGVVGCRVLSLVALQPLRSQDQCKGLFLMSFKAPFLWVWGCYVWRVSHICGKTNMG